MTAARTEYKKMEKLIADGKITINLNTDECDCVSLRHVYRYFDAKKNDDRFKVRLGDVPYENPTYLYFTRIELTIERSSSPKEMEYIRTVRCYHGDSLTMEYKLMYGDDLIVYDVEEFTTIFTYDSMTIRKEEEEK